jgi:hypothetical protein
MYYLGERVYLSINNIQLKPEVDYPSEYYLYDFLMIF